MPNIRIDENALKILQDKKKKMNEEGINANLSDAIRRLKNG